MVINHPRQQPQQQLQRWWELNVEEQSTANGRSPRKVLLLISTSTIPISGRKCSNIPTRICFSRGCKTPRWCRIQTLSSNGWRIWKDWWRNYVQSWRWTVKTASVSMKLIPPMISWWGLHRCWRCLANVLVEWWFSGWKTCSKADSESERLRRLVGIELNDSVVEMITLEVYLSTNCLSFLLETSHIH